jgi:hypothetical protein
MLAWLINNRNGITNVLAVLVTVETAVQTYLQSLSSAVNIEEAILKLALAVIAYFTGKGSV